MSIETKVTVLIFAYNHENYIEETIKSVLSQKCTFKYEVIVFNDCSTDNTLEVVKRLQCKYPDILKIISNSKNQGLNKTFLNAFQYAGGDYIALLGGDDYWISDTKLEMQVNILNSNNEISYIHTAYKSYYEEDNKLVENCNKNWESILTRRAGESALVDVLCHNWTGYPLASSSLFRKAPLLKGIEKHSSILDFNLPGEGTLVHSSMSYYGGFYYFLPVQTTVYRIRKRSLSHYETASDQFDYQKRYFLLRLYTAESYCVSPRRLNKIRRKGMLELFDLSLTLGTIEQFYNFQQSQVLSRNLHLYYDILSHLSKFKLFKDIYKQVRLSCARQRKFTNNIRVFLGRS